MKVQENSNQSQVGEGVEEIGCGSSQDFDCETLLYLPQRIFLLALTIMFDIYFNLDTWYVMDRGRDKV